MLKTPEKIEFAQNVKGWVFVFVTGLLLYFLINRAMNIITKANSELLDSYEQTMCGWIHVMDLRHKETKDHTGRVTVMTMELARLARILEKKLKIIERVYKAAWPEEKVLKHMRGIRPARILILTW